MKTTVDISDALLIRAKRYARKTGQPLRAVLEEGLRRVLDSEPEVAPYKMPDASVGRIGEPNPLESMSWSELRDEMYGGR